MSDQDHGCIVFLLQVIHHIENLSLNRYIQRGRRFISQKKMWIAGQCHCDNNSLLHST